MEIEAKFTVPDAATAHYLARVVQLGRFVLDAPKTLTMRDTFLDTRDRALSRAHVVLRLRRRSDGRRFLTVKSSARRTGAIYRRAETEVELSGKNGGLGQATAEMPPQIAKLIAPLVKHAPLMPLFSIAQTRRIRRIRAGRRVIAEWSLDRVTFRAGHRRRMFYELEIELKNSGTEQELQEIVGELLREAKLKPQREGKFVRALAFSSQAP